MGLLGAWCIDSCLQNPGIRRTMCPHKFSPHTHTNTHTCTQAREWTHGLGEFSLKILPQPMCPLTGLVHVCETVAHTPTYTHSKRPVILSGKQPFFSDFFKIHNAQKPPWLLSADLGCSWLLVAAWGCSWCIESATNQWFVSTKDSENIAHFERKTSHPF